MFVVKFDSDCPTVLVVDWVLSILARTCRRLVFGLVERWEKDEPSELSEVDVCDWESEG